jgi:putative ABC transport system permease protein
MSSLTLAWRNLWRNWKRTFLALIAIGMAQFIVLGMDGFMAGYGDTIINLMTGPMLGHVQVHAPKYREERSMEATIPGASELVKKVAAVPEVTNVLPRIFAPVLAAKTEEGFMGVVVGLDFVAESRPGGLLENASIPASPGEHPKALVGAFLAERQHLKPGDELALIGQTADGAMASELVTVAGIAKSNVDIVNNLGIVVDLPVAQEIFAMGDSVHELTIRGSDPARAEQLARSIAAVPGVGQLETLPWRKLAPEMVQMIDTQDRSTLITLILVFLAAAAGVANTMLMSTFERTREFGMLLALGARPGRILRTIAVEAVTLGLVGLGIGSALGMALNAYLAIHGVDMAAVAGEGVEKLSFQGINFELMIFPKNRGSAILSGVVAMLVTCFLSCIWPAGYLSRLEPTEAMRG